MPPLSEDTVPVPKATVKLSRKGGGRSRNGCLVCKFRRVKCDESKPSCNRCKAGKIICEGYPSQTTIPPRKHGLVPILPRSDILRNPSVDIEGNAVQRRGLHYFRSRRPADTPGNFEPALWETLVLRLSHVYSPVKQSMFALSCIYEEYEKQLGSGNKSDFQISASSVRQYNLAVRELVEYITTNKQDSTVALTSCLIFLWIELLQGHSLSAYNHLTSGLKILNDFNASQWVASPSRTQVIQILHSVDEIHAALTRSFIRLRIQAIGCGRRLPPCIPACSVGVEAFASIPSSFANIYESRNFLDNEYAAIFEFLQRIRDIDYENEREMEEMQRTKDHQIQRLSEWEAANKKMVNESVPAKGHPYSSGVLYLDLYHTVISVVLETICAPSEMVFDEYLEEFEHIYSISEILNRQTVSGAPMLSLDWCIFPPLCIIICKCRYLPLRLKALKLLKSTADQGGMWNKAGFLKSCEHKIRIEEEGRGNLSVTDPLPEEARMYKKRIEYINKGGKDEPVLRYLYFGKGHVEMEFFERADLSDKVVDIKIFGDT